MRVVDKPITLYAINRVFRVVGDTESRLTESKITNNEIDLDKNINLSNEIWRVINLEVPQNLIGVDLELEFESAEKESLAKQLSMLRIMQLYQRIKIVYHR